MDNLEVKELIESFKAYRELLVPVLKNLNDFIGTYDAMRENVDKVNAAFGGSLGGKLDDIFKQMSGQASKAAELASGIDKLASAANKYAGETASVLALLQKTEERVKAVNSMETQAEAQISRLDAILEEKAKSYNLKELQTALDSYNKDVKKVGEFINKDIAQSLFDSGEKLATMKGGLDGAVKKQGESDATLEKLLESYQSSNELLKKIAEKQDVNEAYIFDIMDRWAETRRVKTR